MGKSQMVPQILTFGFRSQAMSLCFTSSLKTLLQPPCFKAGYRSNQTAGTISWFFMPISTTEAEEIKYNHNQHKVAVYQNLVKNLTFKLDYAVPEPIVRHNYYLP